MQVYAIFSSRKIYSQQGLLLQLSLFYFILALKWLGTLNRTANSVPIYIFKKNKKPFEKIANFSCRDRDCPILAESHVVGTSSASCRLPESAAPRRRRLFGGVKSFTMFGGRSQTQGRSISLPESTNLYNFVSSERKILFLLFYSIFLYTLQYHL